MVFTMKPVNSATDPNKRQIMFSSKVSYTVLSDLPPSLIMLSCTMNVNTRIATNSGLLKKFLNTFIYSCFSLRALISLKICNSTNTLKNME
jgi:hypothetical protein